MYHYVIGKRSRRLLAGLTIILVLLAGLLSAPFSSGTTLAQDNGEAYPVLARTSDSRLSVRLPAGWVFEERLKPGELFETELYIGANAEQLQARLASDGDENVRISGQGGSLALLNATAYQETFGEAPTAEGVMSVVVEVSLDSGVEVSPAEPVQVNGLSGVFAAVDSSAVNNEFAVVLALDTPEGVVLATVSSTPDDMSANIGELAGILDTISVPAETAAEVDSTPTTATTDDGLEQVIVAGNGRLQLRIPAGWRRDDLVSDAGVLLLGEDEAALQSRVARNEGDSDPIEGQGGTVALFNYADLGLEPGTPIGEIFDMVSESLAGQGGELLFETNDFELQGNPGQLNFYEIEGGATGLVAVIAMEAEETIVVVILNDSDGERLISNAEDLAGIVDTVRVPAEFVAVQTEAGGVVVQIPQGWHYEDLTAAEQGALVMGNSPDALESRLAGVAGDTVPFSGVGGNVTLFSLSLFTDEGIPEEEVLASMMSFGRDSIEGNGGEFTSDLRELQVNDNDALMTSYRLPDGTAGVIAGILFDEAGTVVLAVFNVGPDEDFEAQAGFLGLLVGQIEVVNP